MESNWELKNKGSLTIIIKMIIRKSSMYYKIEYVSGIIFK